MITSKEDLKRYIINDNNHYTVMNKKTRFFFCLVKDSESMIKKYLKALRKQEYYLNTSNGSKFKSLKALYYERKKHRLGNQLGILIGPNCFEEGLTVYHHGTIIVNPSAKIGMDCKLHGNNCIGNKGVGNDVPTIGNNVDIGFGAVIIGNITIADDIKIGANSVVTRSFTTPGVTIVGVPAREV